MDSPDLTNATTYVVADQPNARRGLAGLLGLGLRGALNIVDVFRSPPPSSSSRGSSSAWDSRG